MMTTADYRTALDAAVREYEALTRERAVLDERIAQLAQAIGNLTRLCGLVPTVPWGLTDACRMVLKAAGHPLTAMEVRSQLEAMGYDLSRYSNELAAIHTILKRLNESGEVQFLPGPWEKPRYGWKASASGRPTVVALTHAEAHALRAGVKPPSGTKTARKKR